MTETTKHIIEPTVHEKGVVRAWKEILMLPTYEAGKPEKNPVFCDKRVYQGSSGVVYPYPVIESVSDEKQDKPYKAMFLENEYLKIMVLPELGGRVQMAYDKIKKRHFVYYNQVIKPALVGLTGPWISGGIEFNWPQHHRPSTFLPVDCMIQENHDDGSATIWCHEIERMSGMCETHGLTLRPGKAYLEISVKIYNRTPFPQTFLWWANPAVSVNEHYHSVFPPDVHAVYDHGRRDVSTFPIATGTYYKQDYSAGVDISRYKNVPVPTSFMAVSSKYDFIGCYEEDTHCGMLHVADHRVSPGKKQWTWGYCDFGRAWDRNLTDEDGPYIELMTGVYTDNQPDFSWIQPYEEKSWTQYFMPFSEVGYVKNATKDVLLGVNIRPTTDASTAFEITVYTTSEYKSLKLIINNGQTVEEQTFDCSPDSPWKFVSEQTMTECCNSVKVQITYSDVLLVEYQPENEADKPTPEPAKAAQDPKDIESVEQLFLTGLHLEQYRHATYNPLDYYDEGLRRETGDVRCNNAKGLLLMRRGQFAAAEPYFRRAIETLTERNPNPYDGEAYYNLGVCLKFLSVETNAGSYDGAYDALFKSTWNAAWQDAAYFALAQIDCIRRDWEKAIDNIERSLIRNRNNAKAIHLKTAILRHLGRKDEVLKSIDIEMFNIPCRFEMYLITADESYIDGIKRISRCSANDYIEYALDYAAAGLYEEAEQFLLKTGEPEHLQSVNILYLLGWIASLSGNNDMSLNYFRKAAVSCPDFYFPNRIEETLILKNAIAQNPSDAFAPYFLGNFYYAARQYDDAIAYWEQAAALNNSFPTLLRNLALAYYNKRNDGKKAQTLMEQAFALDTTDARILMELDQLYRKRGVKPADRLAFMEKYPELINRRDDLFIEYLTLFNNLGRYEEALQLIASRRFHPWEGGEGKVTGQYVLANRELAKELLSKPLNSTSVAIEALTFLHATDVYPENLGEGKLINAEENDINYYKGLAYRALGEEEKAVSFLTKATVGSSEPQQAFFYNDPQPDKIYYQGLAWRALGDEKSAVRCFKRLIAHGKKHLNDKCRIDYFAVSLPDLAIWDEDLNVRNQIHCHYVMDLGYLGLKN
ncbi:MAG: DUF5107 domain-containing protein [Tannerella sp.]|jgi:tetratricopeptide (TPR) repeat protein|nr:DUF5107 domain-containing protein [Tannerella sp.]